MDNDTDPDLLIHIPCAVAPGDYLDVSKDDDGSIIITAVNVCDDGESEAASVKLNAGAAADLIHTVDAFYGVKTESEDLMSDEDWENVVAHLAERWEVPDGIADAVAGSLFERMNAENTSAQDALQIAAFLLDEQL